MHNAINVFGWKTNPSCCFFSLQIAKGERKFSEIHLHISPVPKISVWIINFLLSKSPCHMPDAHSTTKSRNSLYWNKLPY